MFSSNSNAQNSQGFKKYSFDHHRKTVNSGTDNVSQKPADRLLELKLKV